MTERYYTRLLTLVYQNVQGKVKKPKDSKLSHSKKSGRQKVLNFAVGLNINSTIYSFIARKCLICYNTIAVCTQLMSDTSHLSQQNIFIHSYFRRFVSLFCFTVPIVIFLIAWKYI